MRLGTCRRINARHLSRASQTESHSLYGGLLPPFPCFPSILSRDFSCASILFSVSYLYPPMTILDFLILPCHDIIVLRVWFNQITHHVTSSAANQRVPWLSTRDGTTALIWPPRRSSARWSSNLLQHLTSEQGEAMVYGSIATRPSFSRKQRRCL